MPVLTGEVRPSELARLIGADRTADFDRLWTSSRRAVYRDVLARVGYHQPTAEDVLSQTYLRAVAAWPRFENRGVPATGWLVMIARRLVLDRAKSAYQRRSVLVDVLPEPAGNRNPADEIVNAHRAVTVRTALQQIPVRQAQCVALRFMADQSIAETAEAMGCTVGAIKTLQRDGLACLRRHPLICALRGGT
jgi:RNA polymerase sigma-70 factor (ECF subfamily)